MTLTAEQRERVEMPNLGKIALAWADFEDLPSVFPDNAALACDWGEAFCFRCGWFTPTPPASSFTASRRDPNYRLIAAWDAAGGWLERAHLHDHRHGGSNELLNMVPLCVLCHQDQGPCRTRDEGIAFVNSSSHRKDLLWLVQFYTHNNYGNQPSYPGRSEAIRRLQRAYAEAGSAYATEAAKILGAGL